MAIKRAAGAEQPYIPCGPFKIRLPLIHYRLEIPEMIQGVAIVTVSMGAIAVQEELLGVPFELALLMVSLNTLLYFLHPTFGDPVFPGWITPAIPLVTVWVLGFNEGVDRIHAVIALQFCMAAVFLFMGITGLAKKIVHFVPGCIRGGIILGSGISAMESIFKTGGRLEGNEFSIIIGAVVCFIVMYSWRFSVAKDKNVFLRQLSKYGMIPGLMVGFVVGMLTTEMPMPEVEWGLIPFSRFGEILSNYTIFGIGFPPLSMFVSALPLVVSCYIIAFGDFVLAEEVTKEADETRRDELIDFNGNRSNMISGLRNLIMGTVCPYGPLCGPLWAGGTISVAERYKHGRAAMDSIFSGLGTYVLFNFFATLFLPIMTFFEPVYPLGLSLTYVVQAYACAYISIDMLHTKEERSIGAIMGIVLATRGSAWGLATGIVLYLLVGGKKKLSKQEKGASEITAEPL